MRARTVMVTFVLLGACGGPAPAEEQQGGEATSGAEQVEEQRVAWSEMTHEQKAEYMATVVVPRLRPVFQAFDAEEFAEFGCPTCHGENAREVGFRMPNGLHPLDPAQLEAMFASDDPEVQRVAQFMGGQVVPAMAELLGQPPYDPQTHQGFGCFGCHATAQ